MNAASSPSAPWWQKNEEYQFIFLFFLLRFSICTSKVIGVLTFLDVTHKKWLLVLAEVQRRVMGTKNKTSVVLKNALVNAWPTFCLFLLKGPAVQIHRVIFYFTYYRNIATTAAAL